MMVMVVMMMPVMMMAVSRKGTDSNGGKNSCEDQGQYTFHDFFL